MLLLAGGGGLLLILAVGLFLLLRPHGGDDTASPSPTAAPTNDADAKLLGQLLDSRVDLAKRDIEDKNYRAALEKTHEVLGKDPNHAMAQQVQQQAEKALRDVDDTVAATRKAVEAGDVKAASEGLTKIFALDPKNPAAAEFSARLNQFFRSQAEAARKDMADSQRRAERVRNNAQGEYASAAGVGREAEGLFGRGEFAQATRKFSEARDAFESARRAGEHVVVRTPAPTPTPTMMTVATPTPVPTPTPTPVAATPTPEVQPAGGEDRNVREVVTVYARAIGTRNVELLKTVKPDLSGKEQDALRRAPQAEVSMNVLSVATQGEKSTVMVSRTDKLADGGKVFNFQQTLLLVKKDGRWIIQRIAIQQIP